MKKKFFFLLPVLTILLVFVASCADDEDIEADVNIRCNSNADCARNAYCDLENPQQDAELGTLVYYCKKRQLCSTQADCPMNWKCKENEGFCITNKEADALFCKSNDDCLDPSYPKCNLKTGECEASSGGDEELPDSEELPEQPDNEQPDEEENDGDETDTVDDTDTSDDSDTDTAEPEGKSIMSDSFEDGGINWTIEPASEGAQSCWEIKTPNSGPAKAHIGSKAVSTVTADGLYPADCKDLIRYNSAIDIPSSGKPEISFYAWVDLVASYDYVEVLVKEDGKMWEETTGVYLSADTPSSTSALDSSRTKITGQLATDYYKFTGDLSAYKGKKVEIGFRFVSDGSDSASGFYLDDAKLSY